MKNFDAGWKFHRGMFDEKTDISLWEDVTLPHDFSISLPFAGQSEYAFEGTEPKDWQGDALNGFLARGKGCYAKNFSLEVPEGYRAFLVFEGIYRNCTVYINGIEVSRQSNGYMGFETDITDVLKPENRVFVKVDNGRPGTSRWYTGSGIYRHAFLDIRPENYPRDVFITTPEITGEYAQVHISAGFAASAEGTVMILAPSGETVSKAEFKGILEADLTVEKPFLWDIDSPALYTAVIEAAGSRFTYRFGIRSIELIAGKGLFLNGRRVMCKGMNLHHDLGVCGAAAFDGLIEYRLKTLKEMGVNALRLSHNPHAPKVLHLCDELGILVFDECFDKLTDQYVDDFEGTWHRELEAFIKRDRNHPCVFIWSVGNETDQQRLGGKAGAEYIKNIADYAKTLDPTRKVTCAQYPCRYQGITWNDEGWQDSEPAEMCWSTDVCSCNYTWEFFEKDLQKHPELIFIQSEAAVGYADLCGWNKINELPTAGQFYWGGIDYLGEAVSPKYRGWWRGFLDITCHKRAIAYQVEAAFRQTPVIHIGVVGSRDDMMWNDASLEWMFVFDHWNWEEERMLDVIVYSNAASVKLFLNGKAIGECAFSGCFSFKKQVRFVPGKITAVGYDENGKEICRHQLETAGKPAGIRLVPSARCVAACGNDAVAVDAEIVDAQGILCQRSSDTLIFTVENGIFAGIGNADLCTEIPYGTKEYPAFLGRAQAVIRADGSGRDIRLSVRCGDFLKSIVLPVM